MVDLVAERTDLASRLGPRPSANLVVSHPAPTTMRLVAAPDCLCASASIRSPDAVRGHACRLSSVRSNGTWHSRRDGVEGAVELGGLIAAISTLVVRRCARAGLGLAALAHRLVDGDIASGQLTRVQPDWEVAAWTSDVGIWIVYPPRSFLPPKVWAFIDHLRKTVRREKAWREHERAFRCRQLDEPLMEPSHAPLAQVIPDDFESPALVLSVRRSEHRPR